MQWWRVAKRNADLAKELQSDLELEAEEQQENGLSQEDARLAALRAFGNPTLIREQTREAWGWTWIDRLFQDLKYAARTLKRTPAFTITAVLVLAVGTGANIAGFTLFNLFALKPLPVRDPESLVRLQRSSPLGSSNVVPYPSMLFYRDHAKTLAAVMGTMYSSAALEDDPKFKSVDFVTGNYFTELGTEPFLGRLLDSSIDDDPKAAPVVLLSYPLWEQRFGSDPLIIGKVIHLNHRTATIVGVTPRDLAALGGAHPDLWIPIQQVPYFIPGSTVLTDMKNDGGVQMWGRLSPRMSSKVAEQELLALTGQLRIQYPKAIWDKEYIRSDPGGHNDVVQPEIYVATAVIGTLALLILTVACANLGGLLMARGVSREQEMKIRMAIGATRVRIFRQLFTESLLLAFLGTAIGLLLNYLMLRVFLLNEEGSPWMTPTPDWRVIAFAIGLAIFAATAFGFAPAIQIARKRHGGTTARQVLVSAQVGASCILIIIAGLLVRATQHILYATPGFDYERVLAVDLDLSSHHYTAPQARNFLNQFQSRLRAIPSVTSLALSSMAPLGHNRISTITQPINGHAVRTYPFKVDPDFFQTMEIPLLRGRLFLTGEPHAIVISQSMAEKQWPGQDPLGKQSAVGFDPGDVVVGVAGDAHLINIQDNDSVEFYRAIQPADMADLTLLIKTSGAPDGLQGSIRAVIQNLDSGLSPDIRTLHEEFHDATLSAGRMAMVASLIGAVAILLSSLGIFGLVTYIIIQRTKEFAIRLALGSSYRQILGSILLQFKWPVLVGLTVGIAITAVISQVLRRVLFGVSNLDPISYVSAITALLVLLICAASLPATRVLRLNVARALHRE
jgi:predicted permease